LSVHIATRNSKLSLHHLLFLQGESFRFDVEQELFNRAKVHGM
jgi:hypothetical protein